MIENLNFAVLDLETTGFYADKGDRIVEIGIVKIKGGKTSKDEIFSHLFNPQRNIPPSASRVNGISDEMVKNMPLISEKIDEFISFFKDIDYTIIHNAKFDTSFVNYEIKNLGKTFKLPNVICSVELSKRLYPDYNSHNLDIISKRFGFSVEDGEFRHRAVGDAILTSKVFLKFYEDNPLTFLSELEDVKKIFN